MTENLTNRYLYRPKAGNYPLPLDWRLLRPAKLYATIISSLHYFRGGGNPLLPRLIILPIGLLYVVSVFDVKLKVFDYQNLPISGEGLLWSQDHVFRNGADRVSNGAIEFAVFIYTLTSAPNYIEIW